MFIIGMHIDCIGTKKCLKEKVIQLPMNGLLPPLISSHIVFPSLSIHKHLFMLRVSNDIYYWHADDITQFPWSLSLHHDCLAFSTYCSVENPLHISSVRFSWENMGLAYFISSHHTMPQAIVLLCSRYHQVKC